MLSLCRNAFREELKVFAENSTSHLVDPTVLGKKLCFVPLQKTLHLCLTRATWGGKKNVVETRKFLKVLYLEVSGILFINDEIPHAF